MFLNFWRFVTLLLAALGLTLGAAHVLELPRKLLYGAQLYTAVNSTLYLYFGIVGGSIQVAALLAAIVLCWLVRRRRSFWLTLAGAVALAISLGLWASLVQPVNAQWGEIMKSAPAAAPDLYMQLRDRWEYGHVAAFIAWLVGFCCLLASLLVEIPRGANRG